MIQYISSENVRGSKIILWRKSDYNYQIEVISNGVSTTENFEAEYYDALSKFTSIVQQMDLFSLNFDK